MREYIKLLLSTLIALSLLLFSWIKFYDISCIATIFPIVILAIISYGVIEVRMQERRCFRRCYFKENSIISKLLLSKILVTILSFLFSILITFTIIYSVIDFSLNWWLYLIFHTMVSTFLYLTILKKSTSIIKEPYNRIFAKEWSGYIMLLIIIPTFIYSSLNGYLPLYLDNNLEQTMINSLTTISSSCNSIDYILKSLREIDAILWWLILNSTTNIEPIWLKWFIWIGFIIYNSLTLLGINRLIVEVVHIVNSLIISKSNLDKSS